MTRVVVLAGALLSAVAFAQGVPHTLSFTGNLADAGVPMTGNHDFVFTMFDGANTVVWTETQAAVPVTNGLIYTTLGNTTPLTTAILNGAPLSLEVSVDGTALAPRAPIQSVPYAFRAEVANSCEALGTLLPGDVQRRVTGTCSGANAIQTIDAAGAVTCVAVGGGGSYTAEPSGGLALSAGNAFSIAANGVTNGMLASSSVTVTPGTGLSGGGAVALGGSTTLSLASPVAIANGGTGITVGPTASNHFLRAGGGAGWSVGTIQTTDIPDLTATYVDKASTQLINGPKTFSSIITGSLSGNVTGNVTGNVSGSAASFTGALAGDVTGTQGATSVVGIRGYAVANSAPATNQVLKYLAGGWTPGPVALSTDVTGTLPIANGGTGSATQNFVDLSTAQSVAGAKTFTSAVAASDFTYSAPLVGYTYINPSDCVRQNTDPNNQNMTLVAPPANFHGPFVSLANAPATTAVTAVCASTYQPPPGAVVIVTGATLVFADASPTCLVGGKVVSKLQPSPTGQWLVAGSVYSGADDADYAAIGGFNATKPVVTFVPFTIVRTATAATAVYFELYMAQTAVSSDCRFQGVILQYEVSKP